MKQTQTEHQEAGAEQTGPGQIEQRENAAMQRKPGQPQSWRAYIEQTMPTQEAAAQTQPQRRPRKSAFPTVMFSYTILIATLLFNSQISFWFSLIIITQNQFGLTSFLD